MTLYTYRYVDLPRFTKWSIEKVVRSFNLGLRTICLTLDLGISTSCIELRDDSLTLNNCEIHIDELKDLKDDVIYELSTKDCVFRALTIYIGNKFYKLKPVGEEEAPTIEISGIQMHRTVGITPWRDSEIKVRTLGNVRNKRVLDIGTGLGYTASWALRLGAKEVITIEIDENVLKLAQHNPWSRTLESKGIKIYLANALNLLPQIPDNSFDIIVHDPPRISIAGELYSYEFYKELYRVLKPGGKMFHYTGFPGKHSNISYLKGIKERLSRAGFESIKWIEKAQGFKAFKLKYY
ncbi:MAG: methyltransferase [Thermoprotei archaeon]|nr:MAG: methyltransferase [Thermoprotei archaeon]